MTATRETTRTRQSPINRAARSLRRAFTILEMLITISIIALSAVVILPAFNSALQSSNYAAAVNTVTATLGNARALAIQSGEFTAVAFLFDTETQTYTLLPLELHREQKPVLARFQSGCASNVNANAYRPATGAVPVTLPGGTGVYGFSLQTEPLGCCPINEASGGLPRTLNWYAGEAIVVGNMVTTPWIFPRNDPRHFMPEGQNPFDVIRGTADGNAADADLALRHAQSFMIQFSPQGTTVDALPGSRALPLFNGYIEYPDLPINEFDDSTFDSETGRFEPYDDEFAFDPENRDNLRADRDADDNPEVFLRSASLLAVVSFDQLRRESGIDPAISAPWFVRPAEASAVDVAPMRDDLDPAYYQEVSVTAISDWIDGNAEIIGFNRYTGTVIRRSN